MSGTSCDGIDAALVNIDDSGIECLATYHEVYPNKLKTILLSVIAGKAASARLFSNLDCQLATCYAQVVKSILSQANVRPEQVQAIGLHGQTIDHNPPVNTWQLGSAAHVAALTGIDVIADFRSLDVAYGGQGAPLAPALHKEVFYQGKPLAVLNLGGIANLSYITEQRVIGFDTGPANCLMDLWANKHLQIDYDQSGLWAAKGVVCDDLLQALLSEPYFSNRPPKSTGRELFHLKWLEKHLADLETLSPQDIQATLLALTVMTISNDVDTYAADASQLIVCGGGVHNTTLMSQLEKQLHMPVISSQSVGVNPDHVESVLMAWLASKYQDPLDLIQITGSKVAHRFGVLYKGKVETKSKEADS